MLSKLNNYQKTVILWGVVCFVGFVGSQILPFMSEINPVLGDLRLSLGIWLVLTALALFFQVYWMWFNNTASIGSQLTWIVVAIVGWVLTYFKLYGYILLETKATSMWLGLCAVAMVLTALFYRNNLSYYFLAAVYTCAAVIIQINQFPFELIIVGTIFLVIGILDAYLEHSSWRKGLAEI